MRKMKVLGLIGGLSWESTTEYYKIINEMVKVQLGGWNSAPLILYSVNFDQIVQLMDKGDWGEIQKYMVEIALKIQTAGAEALVICTNTIHKVADQIQSKIKIPLLNIVDAIGERIQLAKIQKVGLLGTRFTMEDGFYTTRLKNNYKIETIIPPPLDRDFIHATIFNELTQGVINPESRIRMIKIIQTLIEAGAQAIILGCTELPMIIGGNDVSVPLYDSLQIHIEKTVSWALGLAS